MKCSRITLFDRSDRSVKLPKHDCNYQRAYQPELHNYVSWLNKRHNLYEEEQPYLTVCNISLPQDITVFMDRGAQSQKWIQKRPRLQSARSKPSEDSKSEGDEKDGEDDEKDSELMQIQQVMEEYEIDENVQKLIQEAAEYDQNAHDDFDEELEIVEEETDDEELDRRKLRKSARYKEKRVKLSRTISFSRLPSPETIQIIRVDVTSNYSLDGLHYCSDSEHNSEVSFDELADEEGMKMESNMDAPSNRLRPRKSLIKCPPELTLQCQKLALSDRKSTGQMQ